MDSIPSWVSAARSGALALLLLVGAPTSAGASDTEEVRDYLISISRLFEELEFERALSQIQLAQRLPRSPEEEVALALYEGIIQYELNKKDQSAAALKTALLLRPEAPLPVQVSPKLRQFFESLRQQVKLELEPLLAKREAERQKAERQKAEAMAQPSQSLLPVQPLAPGPPPPEEPRQVPRQSGARGYALLPAIAGGALVAVGGISWGLSRRELSQLRATDPRLETQEAVQRTASRGRTWQTVGVSLLGVGATSLAVAGGMYALGGPDRSVALGVSVNGASASVYGRWP